MAEGAGRGPIGRRGSMMLVIMVLVAVLIAGAIWVLGDGGADDRVVKVQARELVLVQKDLPAWTQNGLISYGAGNPGYNITEVAGVHFDNYSGLGPQTTLYLGISQYSDVVNASGWYEHSLQTLMRSTNETTRTALPVSVGERSYMVHDQVAGWDSWSILFQQRNIVVEMLVIGPMGTDVLEENIKEVAEAQNNRLLEHLG